MAYSSRIEPAANAVSNSVGAPFAMLVRTGQTFSIIAGRISTVLRRADAWPEFRSPALNLTDAIDVGVQHHQKKTNLGWPYLTAGSESILVKWYAR